MIRNEFPYKSQECQGKTFGLLVALRLALRNWVVLSGASCFSFHPSVCGVLVCPVDEITLSVFWQEGGGLVGESGICIGSIKASFHVSLVSFLPHVPQLMTNLIGPAFDMLERLPHTHFPFSDPGHPLSDYCSSHTCLPASNLILLWFPWFLRSFVVWLFCCC